MNSHPLRGAQLRFERADRHLTEADDLIDAFANGCKQYLVAENHGDKVAIGLPRVPDLDPMLPVVVSDAIHNLRAALDYIVYELAKHDSPSKRPDGTQFIIEDVKSDPLDPRRGFDVRKKQYLKLLSGPHIDMIEDLQPYKGIEWTKTLRDISNPDKHRTLTAITRSGAYGVTFAGHVDLRANPIRFRPEDVQIDAYRAVQIAPPDETKPGLMETLRRLEAEVSRTIELFKPEFTV